jgi:hypothetical protein
MLTVIKMVTGTSLEVISVKEDTSFHNFLFNFIYIPQFLGQPVPLAPVMNHHCTFPPCIIPKFLII